MTNCIIKLPRIVDSFGAVESMFFRMVHSYKLPEVQWSIPASCVKDEMLENRCPCNTTDPLVIICEARDFKKIPENTKQTVYKIRMSSNQIVSLNHVKWPLALKKLVLEDNKLSNLDNDTFISAPNLEGLFLSGNQIEHIDEDAFRGAHQLIRLELRNNMLSELDLVVFKNTEKLSFLDLSRNKIEFVDNLEFRSLKNLLDLNLNDNSIVNIGSEPFAYMPKISSLSLENNEIVSIADFAFYNSSSLTEINLSRNKIAHLTREIFISLSKLKKLDLSKNYPLHELQNDTFRELPNLKSLELSGLSLRNLNKAWFSYLDLKFVYFSQFDHCFYASKARVCSPHSDGISTGSQLVLSEFKYYVWAIATVCCLGNLFVFAWRSPREDQSLSLIVRNLSIADLMMGLYLVAVGWKNEHFGNMYGSQAIDWINSSPCTLMGFMAILSSELSLSIIFIITIERYRSITSLVHLEKFELRERARILLAYAWFAAITIALIPLIGWLFEEKVHIYGNNGLCLPLYIDNPFSKGWQYSAIVYLGINFAAVMIILGLYVRMYLIIMSVRNKTRPIRTLLASNATSARQREDVTLALRFLFIVVADCLCWIPIVVIKFCALIGLKITGDIYCWLAVFILPINSALNPIIYTIGTPSYLRTVIFNKIIGILTLLSKFLSATWQSGPKFLSNPMEIFSLRKRRDRKRMSYSSSPSASGPSTSMRVNLGLANNNNCIESSSTTKTSCLLNLHQRQSCDSASSETSSLPRSSLAYIMQTYLKQAQKSNYQDQTKQRFKQNSKFSESAEHEMLISSNQQKVAIAAPPPYVNHVAIFDQLLFIDDDQDDDNDDTENNNDHVSLNNELNSTGLQLGKDVAKRIICELDLKQNDENELVHYGSNLKFARNFLCKFDETLGKSQHEIMSQSNLLRPQRLNSIEQLQARIALDSKPLISRSWLIRATSNSKNYYTNNNRPQFKCKNVNCLRSILLDRARNRDLIELFVDEPTSMEKAMTNGKVAAKEHEVDIVELAAEVILGVNREAANLQPQQQHDAPS